MCLLQSMLRNSRGNHKSNENEHVENTELQQPVAESAPSIPPGYPKLAERMSAIPEAAIFRRFGDLNAQNLLYLQAELVNMEYRLKEIQNEDSSGDGYRKRFKEDWEYLQQSEGEQWQLLREIQKTLKEYSAFPCVSRHTPFSTFLHMLTLPDTALIQQASIVKMVPPCAWDLNHIQTFLETPEMGPFSLCGRDSNTWGFTHDNKNHAPDLVALLPRNEEDAFTRWVSNEAIKGAFQLRWLQSWKMMQSSKVSGLLGCKDSTLARCTFVVTSMLASVLLILSVSVLYLVHTLEARLGLIAAFNLLLTFILATFTTAKRAEVFAVAAGWAAVQVVFIQVGTDSSCGH